MDFLGVRISKHSATIDLAKIAGIAEYPCNILNLRQAWGFLGVTSYHRIFIKNFSIIAAPITWLTSKDIPFKWGPEQQAAQEEIICLITHPPVLVKPDPSRQFEIEVDTSQIGMGAILYQHNPPTKRKDGTDKLGPQRPVGFHSQKFTTTKQNYPIYNREFLAIICGLRCWLHLLKGTEIPVLGLYRPCQLTILSGPKEDWSQGGQLPARKGAIQYLTGIQTWCYKSCRRLIMVTWLWRVKSWQQGYLSVARRIFLQAPHVHQSLRYGQHSWQYWPKSQTSTIPQTRNPQAMGPSSQSHLTGWHPLASRDHLGCCGRQWT